MPLQAGDKLGPYEILAPIGAGGMGEVYRARDTKLKRDVAIKVLPEAVARDPERMVRFQREAEVLASLNHPNIAAIYGVEERALVMELVEGDSPKGPLPFDEAWKIASQIVAALEYAHERGIMHRDLKPANIKITPEGVVKLLDFGLAKAFTNQREPSASPENSPTLTLGATEVGVILGTAAYMAPEQARGKQVDKRADIWSFGVVLYELLTGERPFSGEDAAETLAAVIHKQPDVMKVPRQAQRLLEECLQKDPKQRLRDIGDAKRLLGGGPPTPPPPAFRHRSWLPWCIAAFVLLALMPANIIYLRKTPLPEHTIRFQIPIPENATDVVSALSPDARFLAISAARGGKRQLWIRSLDSFTAQLLAGTEGAIFPFWSPDGAFVAFFADRKLKKIPVAGGPPVTLCDAPAGGRGGTWNRDGIILFSPGGDALFRVSDTGGVPTPVTKLASQLDTHRYPEFLPDGKHFLFTTGQGGVPGAIYAGALDGSAPVRITDDSSSASYLPLRNDVNRGYLLFRRGDGLVALPFDSTRLKVIGEVFPVTEQIGISGNTMHANFSVSSAGTLTYSTGNLQSIRQLVWIDRAGKNLGMVGQPGVIDAPVLAPNGKSVVFGLPNPGNDNQDLWLLDLSRGGASRFTFGKNSRSLVPVWSLDSSQIAFYSTTHEIIRKPSNGAGAEESLAHDLYQNSFPSDWSPDGKFIVYLQRSVSNPWDLWLLPLVGDGKPFPYLVSPFEKSNAQFSPDGKWMAYVSNESGQPEVYIQSIPVGRGKWQISTAGGEQPKWRRDGRELFYIGADRRLMAVPVKLTATVETAAAVPLFEIPPTNTLNAEARYEYQPAADGQRFLVTRVASGAVSPPINVVLNWTPGNANR